MSNQRGSAAAVALGVMVILAIIAAGVLPMATSAVRMSRENSEGMTAQAAAEAGIARGIYALSHWMSNRNSIFTPTATNVSLNDPTDASFALAVTPAVQNTGLPDTGTYYITSTGTMTGSNGLVVTKQIVQPYLIQGNTVTNGTTMSAGNLINGMSTVATTGSVITGPAGWSQPGQLTNNKVVAGTNWNHQGTSNTSDNTYQHYGIWTVNSNGELSVVPGTSSAWDWSVNTLAYVHAPMTNAMFVLQFQFPASSSSTSYGLGILYDATFDNNSVINKGYVVQLDPGMEGSNAFLNVRQWNNYTEQNHTGPGPDGTYAWALRPAIMKKGTSGETAWHYLTVVVRGTTMYAYIYDTPPTTAWSTSAWSSSLVLTYTDSSSPPLATSGTFGIKIWGDATIKVKNPVVIPM